MIYENLPKIGKIKYIALSVKFIKNIEIKNDEIYLLFVGIIVIPEVELIITEAEKSLEGVLITQ